MNWSRMLCLALAFAWPRDVGATEQCDLGRAKPDPTEPAQLTVGPELAVLCLPPPVDIAQVQSVGPPLPFRCANSRCELNDPHHGGLFQIDGPDGEPRRFVTQGALWYALAETDTAVRALDTRGPIRMRPRTESPDCSRMPEGTLLKAGQAYVAYSAADAVLLAVTDAPVDAPPAPKLEKRTVGLTLPCRDHGAFTWSGAAPEHKLRWRVLAGDGSTELLSPFVSSSILVLGVRADDLRPGELILGGEYVLEAQTLARDGRPSPPVRIPFTLEQTGEGVGAGLPGALVVAAIGVAAVGGALALGCLVIVIVVVVRRRRRRRRA